MIGKLKQALQQRLSKFLDFMSIRRKLTLAFLVVSIIPIFIIGLFSAIASLSFQSSNQNQIFMQNSYISKLIWSDFTKDLQNTTEHLGTDNLIIVNNDLGLIQPIQEYIAKIVKKNGFSFGGLINNNGEIVCTQSDVFYSSQVFPFKTDPNPSENTSLFAIMQKGELESLYGNSISTKHELVIVSLFPLINYQGQAQGWVYIGAILSKDYSEALARMFENMAEKTKSIVSLFVDNDLYTSSEQFELLNKSNFELPSSNLETWLSPIQIVTSKSGNFLSQYFVLGSAGQSKVFLFSMMKNDDFVLSQAILIAIIIGVLAITLLVVIWAGRFLTNIFSKPILAISEGSKEIMSGNFDYKITGSYHDEIGDMAENFNAMTQRISNLLIDLSKEVKEHESAEQEVRKLNEELEGRVEERTKELLNSNEALAASLSDLRKTQKHLLENEKLAALGTLITGISHELNTPLGNLLTASSMLSNETGKFKEGFHKSTMTKTGLDVYLTQSQELARVLTSNTESMIQKLSLFSKLSAEETDQTQSSINLHEFVESFATNLRSGPLYKQVKFTNLIDEGFQIKTWIGVLFQIYSHISTNSLQHAFIGKAKPEISYTARLEEHGYELGIVDNGIGIAPEIQEHIFEPFFTTDMGNDRSGLGLSIVYNIIKKKLNGQITISSAPDRGTSFFIHIPKTA